MEQIDRALIQACVRQDRMAQKRLYEICFPELIRICMRYHRQEEFAVEVLNVGFMKILTNLDKYPEEVPFLSWARRVVINCLIDDYRKQKRYKNAIQFPDLQAQSEFQQYAEQVDYNDAEARLEAEDLMRIIDTLPELRRQIFLLFAVEGYSHQEIGEQFEIAEGTSKWHVSEARKHLRHLVEKYMSKNTVRNGSVR